MLAVALSSVFSLVVASLNFAPAASHPVPDPIPLPNPSPNPVASPNVLDFQTGVNVAVSIVGAAGLALATRTPPSLPTVLGIYNTKLNDIYAQIDTAIHVNSGSSSPSESSSDPGIDISFVSSLVKSLGETLDHLTADIYALKAYPDQTHQDRLGGLTEDQIAQKVGEVINTVLEKLELVADVCDSAGLEAQIETPIVSIGTSISACLTAILKIFANFDVLLSSIIEPVPVTLKYLGFDFKLVAAFGLTGSVLAAVGLS